MGYDLHITRKEDWSDEDSWFDIPLDEWKSLVANDPDLAIDCSASVFTPQGERCMYKWTKPFSNGNDCAWFDLEDGNIDVKNPDDDTIKKMLQDGFVA